MLKRALALPRMIASPAQKDILTTLLFALILFGFLGSMMLSQLRFSPVGDEFANIPGGLNFWATGRYTDATQPPLLRYLIAIPQYFAGVDPLPNEASGGAQWKAYGRKYMYGNKVPWQTILFSARTVIIMLSGVLLWLLFFWTKQLWGRKAGFAALVFMAFEPTFLGHGQLATLDSALSLAFLFSVFSLWQYLSKPTWSSFLLLNFATAIALLTKFSAISLIFSAAICLFIFRKKADLKLMRFWLSPFIFLFLIWAAYLFQIKSPAEDVQISQARESFQLQTQLDKVAANLGMTKSEMLAIRIPAYDFWKGFGMQTFHAMFQDVWKKKDDFQFLNGEYSRRGWRSYFAWTFLLKSTIPSVLLLLLLVYFGARRSLSRSFSPNLTAFCLSVPPLVLFIICSLGTINIGHRYILPIYPFLAMGVGFLATQKVKWVKYSVFGLLLAHIASSTAAWPNHLGYFNELSRNGFYLSDSNIDWGQDVLYLQKDLESPTVKTSAISGALFGQTQPSDLGINLPSIPAQFDSLKQGPNTIYLSVDHYLTRSSVHPNGPYPWLSSLKPTRRVGSSILVFEIEK